MSNQEAIELLKENEWSRPSPSLRNEDGSPKATCVVCGMPKDRGVHYGDCWLTQAIAALSKQPEQSESVSFDLKKPPKVTAERLSLSPNDFKKQPEPTELAKELREQHNVVKYDLRFREVAAEEAKDKKHHYKMTQYCKRIEEACDIIDRQAARIKELEKQPEPTICVECGSKDVKIVIEIDRNFYLKDHKPCLIPVQRCKQCGLMFFDDLLSDIASKIILANEKQPESSEFRKRLEAWVKRVGDIIAQSGHLKSGDLREILTQLSLFLDQILTELDRQAAENKNLEIRLEESRRLGKNHKDRELANAKRCVKYYEQIKGLNKEIVLLDVDNTRLKEEIIKLKTQMQPNEIEQEMLDATSRKKLKEHGIEYKD